jgi:hypothetical protein
LAVEREREAEVDQLRDDAGPVGRPAHLLLDPAGRSLDEARGRRAWRVTGDLNLWHTGSADRVEIDHGDDGERRVRREAQRAEAAERAGVGRQEHDRVPRPHTRARCRRDRIAAGELDERGRARRVVVGAGAVTRVVTVRHHDDRPA